MRLSSFVPLALLVAGCASTPRPKVAEPRIVPLRAVRLYETGVGYFERSGELGGDGSSLPVPASHLDDALQSLVVLSPGSDASVAAIAFSSSVSATRARSRAGLPESSAIRFRDLLASLKGEPVELVGRGKSRGRVVDVVDEDPPPVEAPKPDAPPPHKTTWVLLLADDGRIVRERVDDLADVHPLDPAFSARLGAALDVLSPRSAQRERTLALLGKTRGPVAFGYVAETPVWRATYRLVLHDDRAAGLLEGWALVHNDTDEPWHDVHLELANGLPDSFVHPLAAPRYVHRALVGPDGALSTIPQLGDRTADDLWGDGAHGSGTGEGFGYGYGRLGGSHRTKSPQVRMGMTRVGGTVTTSSTLLDVGNLAEVAQATGLESGAQFLYRPEAPFSLGAHASALVPIVSREVVVEPLVVFADESSHGRTALRITNATGQTLAGGTIAVFGGGGLVGEAAFDRAKPGEKRVVEVGTDLDVELEARSSSATEETKRVTFDGEWLEEHFLRTTERRLDVEDRSDHDETVWLAIDTVGHASLSGTDGVELDPATEHPIAVFLAKAHQKATRTFRVVEGLERRTDLDSLTAKMLAELAKKPALPQTEQAALADASARLAEAEGLATEARGAQHDAGSIEADLDRLREDLKALGDKAATSAPLVKRVLDGEDRLGAARKRQEAYEKDARAKRELAKQALGKLARPS